MSGCNLLILSVLSSVFWSRMQACWEFSFSSSWSPRNRRLSQKSKHVGTLPFVHSLPHIALLSVPWHALSLSLSLSRSPYWQSFFNQLELDMLVINWPFGFPVLTINMYAQKIRKALCFIYSVRTFFFYIYKRLWYRQSSHVLKYFMAVTF